MRHVIALWDKPYSRINALHIAWRRAASPLRLPPVPHWSRLLFVPQSWSVSPCGGCRSHMSQALMFVPNTMFEEAHGVHGQCAALQGLWRESGSKEKDRHVLSNSVTSPSAANMLWCFLARVWLHVRSFKEEFTDRHSHKSHLRSRSEFGVGEDNRAHGQGRHRLSQGERRTQPDSSKKSQWSRGVVRTG